MSRRTNESIGCAFVGFLLISGVVFLIKSCINDDISLPKRKEYTYEDARRDQDKKRIEEYIKKEENYKRRGICPTCHGKGSIYVIYKYSNGNCYETICPLDEMHVDPKGQKDIELKTCSSCNGTGKYPPNSQHSTHSPSKGSNNNITINRSSTTESSSIQNKKCEHCHGSGRYLGVSADPNYPHAKGDMYFYCGLCNQHFLYTTKDAYGNTIYLEENSNKHNHNCPYCHGTGMSN